MGPFLKTLVMVLVITGGDVSSAELKSSSKPFKPAVLDIDRVIRDAAVSTYIQETVEERRTALQKDVEGYEKELRAQETALKNLQNKRDPNFENEQKSFENKVTDVQKRLSGRTKILEKSFHEARSKVIRQIMALVNELAEAEGITLVIPKNVVMYQDEGYDITDRILARLDKDMPKIDIQFPEGV